MRQEYHYTISRTDRICLVIFVTVLMMWELIKYALPDTTFNYLATPEEINEETEATPDIAEYYSPKYERKKKTNYKRKQRNYYTPYKNEYSQSNEIILLDGPVEIMSADSDQLMAMGFSKKVANNITKFISAGAVIRHEKDLQKIYGMDSLQLAAALPFIIFPESQNFEATEKPVSVKVSLPTNIINLNQATAEELEALPGIGTTLAERIIKFRESLGGFITKEQLMDCYGITPELYQKLEAQLQASGTPYQIHINEADLSTLSHPYLPKKYLRVLQAYKNHHGLFKNESDLRQVFPHDSMWCEKLLPYIVF